MDSPDILPSCSNSNVTDSNDSGNLRPLKSQEDFSELRDQAIENFQKPNLPNVNVPEKIIICLDLCYDNENAHYRLADGSTYRPVKMLKRVLEFFVYTKHAINKRTKFALVMLKEEPCWIQGFTNNPKDILSMAEYLSPEESTSETIDFQKLFQILKQEIEVPEYSQGDCILPPPYVVRMIVLYGRSNCVPQIPQDDPYFIYLKKQFYFYIDILLAHEEDCAAYKCEEVYDALQDLDNGYSYVYEVSRNATKIHDCIAKLLAHPLQRPLQKNTDYSFGCRY
ncbi:BRISC and BRCA1-A complex member 1 [Papilio xuthus]|uniref:BRISC and BRCA1-A complex member 1 n=1 Tax=Papilio xuthus TaxID=66420 RepID=A0A194QBU4_PAPXU|nr:BRISC and BRCA1-A complex member 1 [Papilio xuthus]